jgi:hypothetical protein
MLAALFLVSAAPAHAATPRNSADSTSGWVYYPVGATLTNPTTTTVTGTPANGGCEYDASGAGSGGSDTQSEAIQTGENASTCTAQFEVGTPTNVTADTTPPSGSLSDSTSASGTPAATSSDPSSYQDNKWLDPFGIQVNAQEQWLSWTKSYCHIAWSARWKWSWYFDGWAKEYGSGNASANCTRAINNGDSGFSNAVFCTVITGHAGPPTLTDFGNRGPDVLTGTYTGGWTWNYNDTKWGGCSNLLHHGHVFTFHA